MKILADIGGTYIRTRLWDGSDLSDITKQPVRDFPSPQAALQNLNLPKAPILIATAAYEDTDGVWRFVNNKEWAIDPNALAEAGYPIEMILNDFEAATWALIDVEKFETLYAGEQGISAHKCLLGPGTGMGLGYLLQQNNNYIVQKTHGGLMPLTLQTQQQWDVLQALQHLHPNQTYIWTENILSGPGLLNLYNAHCVLSDTKPTIDKTEDLLSLAGQKIFTDVMTSFHELFGTFAANAVIYGHAYGGLYITGGVFEKLQEAGHFDFDKFHMAFCLNGPASTTHDLKKTPIHGITDRNPAMKGLIKAHQFSN
jgi:glucokinase